MFTFFACKHVLIIMMENFFWHSERATVIIKQDFLEVDKGQKCTYWQQTNFFQFAERNLHKHSYKFILYTMHLVYWLYSNK